MTPDADTIIGNTGTRHTTVTGVTNTDSLFLAVWSEANPAVVYYPATNQGGGVWTADINIADHPTPSANHVHAYFTNPGTGTPCAQSNFTLVAAGTPPPPPPPPPPICPLPTFTSSLTASVTVNQPFSYTLTATTTGVTATTTNFTVATSSLPAGLSFASSTGVISGTPTATGAFNVVISVSNDCGADSKTLVITVNPVTTGGGGGGSSRPPSGGSVVTSPSPSSLVCFYLRDYLRRDFDNDPLEVLKLQAFLINFEGHNNVSLTGVFDQATFDAVSAFQMKYFNDILEPWGHTGPTGYVYILTTKKINEIYCQHLFPLNQAQINEIAAFRAFLESLREQGINPELPPSLEATTTTPTIPIVGEARPSPQGQSLRNLAAAIFAPPETLLDTAKCLYWFILILVVLYIVASVLKNVLYKDVPENNRKRFLTKWLTIDIGLVICIIIALLLEEWCLILPLLIALVLSLVWTLSYPEHNSMRASVKSWYLVSLARIKSILKENKGLPKTDPIKEEPVMWNIKSIQKESTPEVIFIEPKIEPKIEPTKIEPKK